MQKVCAQTHGDKPTTLAKAYDLESQAIDEIESLNVLKQSRAPPTIFSKGTLHNIPETNSNTASSTNYSRTTTADPETATFDFCKGQVKTDRSTAFGQTSRVGMDSFYFAQGHDTQGIQRETFLLTPTTYVFYPK